MSEKITLGDFQTIYYMERKVFHYKGYEIKVPNEKDIKKTIYHIEMGETNTLWIYLDK